MRKFLVLAVLLLAGCAGTTAAYREADSLYETAYVLVEHYSIVVERANRVQMRLPKEQQDALREVRDKANAVVLQIPNLAAKYQEARTAENQAALEAAVAEASVALAELTRTLRGN